MPRKSKAAPAPKAVPAANDAKDFVLVRTFRAPRKLVYEAWTDPKKMAHWWGPKNFTAPVIDMDVRVGGQYRWVMRGPDGVEYPVKGEFMVVKPYEQLAFSEDCSEHPADWFDMVCPDRDPSDPTPVLNLVTEVTFEDAGEGQTKLTIRSAYPTTAMRDAFVKVCMREGWMQSLDKMDNIVAPTTDRELVQVRDLEAPRHLVFQAWSDPKRIDVWWGPKGFRNKTHKMSFKNGGEWIYTMHGPDGVDYENKVVYIDIQEPERLTYWHGDGGDEKMHQPFHVTVTFESIGEKRTRLTMKMVIATAEEKEKLVQFGAIEGGVQTIDRLVEYLAKGSA